MADLYPFSDEAVEAIVASLPNKTTRELVRACRKAIDYLADSPEINLPATRSAIEDSMVSFADSVGPITQ